MRIREIPAETILKIALTILGYLVMGVWLAGKISAGNEAMRTDINRLDESVKHLSDRFDKHIDKDK